MQFAVSKISLCYLIKRVADPITFSLQETHRTLSNKKPGSDSPTLSFRFYVRRPRFFSTQSRKKRSVIAIESPTQGVRSFNPTFQPGPF